MTEYLVMNKFAMGTHTMDGYSKNARYNLITLEPVINMNDGFFSHFSLSLLNIQHQSVLVITLFDVQQILVHVTLFDIFLIIPL